MRVATGNIHECQRLNFPWEVLTEQVNTVKPDVRVQNMVVTFGTLKDRNQYDLQYLADNVDECRYDQESFSAVIHTIPEPKSTALIFKSGKIVVTGTKSEKDAKIASRKHSKMLQNIFPLMEIYFDNYTIQNLVGSGDITFPVSLENFARLNSEESSYDPENFSGLTFRSKAMQVTFLIFVSGNLVITGAKSEKHLRESFNTILPILERFKKHGESDNGRNLSAKSAKGAKDQLNIRSLQKIGKTTAGTTLRKSITPKRAKNEFEQRN